MSHKANDYFVTYDVSGTPVYIGDTVRVVGIKYMVFEITNIYLTRTGDCVKPPYQAWIKREARNGYTDNVIQLVFCGFQRNRPRLMLQCGYGGFVCGLMAQSSWVKKIDRKNVEKSIKPLDGWMLLGGWPIGSSKEKTRWKKIRERLLTLKK